MVCSCRSGNTGEGLNGDRSQLGVYISRDGGFSWSQIQRGHWTFQMVALGSVIVMAPKRTTVDPLDYVLYVCLHCSCSSLRVHSYTTHSPLGVSDTCL